MKKITIDLNSLSKTKMVCTLGPVSSSREMIEKFIDGGMNVARLNFSHGDHPLHAANIALVREVAKEKNKAVAILQDLQGPKIRTGALLNNALHITDGQHLTLRYGTQQTEANIVPIDYKELAHDVKIGARILLDDGLMTMRITDIKGSDVECVVEHGGLLKSRKGVNFPECHLSIPATTEKDIRDLLFGVSQGVDYIALSFVQTAKDIQKLKMMLRALGADIPVISKIEMLSAIEHIEEISEVSDGIMVARGDLGVECGFAGVAAFQKKIIEAALAKGKPVIVATQMLDSMIENRRPTKAEVCDVANAVYDRADATMLSGESASGKYPELAVQTMRDILDRVDHSHSLKPLIKKRLIGTEKKSAAEMVAYIAADIAQKMPVNAIVCLTLTGSMARLIAKYRPDTPIIAFSPRPDVVRKLSLVRNVIGILNTIFYDTDTAFSQIAKYLVEEGYVKEGDLLLITGGVPITQMLPTNTLKIHRIGASS